MAAELQFDVAEKIFIGFDVKELMRFKCVYDYMVIVGFMKDNGPARFLVLTLQTYTWKYIGLVNYRNIGRQSAILCNGALHWFMKTTNREKNENVILSFDLSLNEYKEIPLPDDHDNNKSDRDHKSLGIINECLCICDDQKPYHMWVMKNYNVKESWDLRDLYQYGDYCATKSDIVHHVELVAGGIISYKIIRSSLSAYCVSDPIFVQSLASPHLYNNGRPKKASKVSKNNKKGV
uniref:F-box/kelch-repeat protein At3g06240-like n=1 Tax=Erigeron canadensis TaxID=72917 RepID=UPI001CB9D111|nr:F-box/kelch-repeat protein At3g06240-like [Erigeron canadensis]